MSQRRTGHERNVDGLRAAADRKHQEAARKVYDAIRGLLRAAEPITFRRVATVARVSTGWLYAQPDVKERIRRLRGQPADKAGPPAERASYASKDAIVRALRQRVTTLDNERHQLLARIDQLQQRIEVLYGELYAKRVDGPYAIADPGSFSPPS
jgi:predicted RNase H-like nuclease (RuvC/YqgF family)